MIKFLKRLLFSLIIFILLVEFISFFLNKFDNTEIFKTRIFTEKTNDGRMFTLKKNFNHNQSEIYEGEKKNWQIYTSEERIRVGTSKNIDTKNDIFLFLGDSVPFGWGVDYENSLPFYFQKLNQNLNVINGAIPSYSLNQAVERFFIEFKDYKNLKYVYLQIYDPAPIYALLGDKWETEDNWVTLHKYIFRENKIIDLSIPLYGELYFQKFLKKKIYRIKIKKLKQINTSQKSEFKYLKHIDDNINRIYNYLNERGVKLILTPIIVPNKSFENLDNQNKKSIILLNKTFENFAINNEGVEFFKISDKLIFDSKNFIDKCCHLSEKGASLMAKELNKLIKLIIN